MPSQLFLFRLRCFLSRLSPAFVLARAENSTFPGIIPLPLPEAFEVPFNVETVKPEDNSTPFPSVTGPSPTSRGRPLPPPDAAICSFRLLLTCFFSIVRERDCTFSNPCFEFPFGLSTEVMKKRFYLVQFFRLIHLLCHPLSSCPRPLFLFPSQSPFPKKPIQNLSWGIWFWVSVPKKKCPCWLQTSVQNPSGSRFFKIYFFPGVSPTEAARSLPLCLCCASGHS